jgi:Domain of unknown function (DUF4383)
MRDRTTAQQITMLFGIVFLAAGILGFVPGITTNYDDLSFAGADSDAKLIGLFQISVLHNIVHALFGIAGLAMARTFEGARTYLLGSGIIYVVLVVYGILFGGDNGDGNFVPVNDWDTYFLHVVLAVGLLASWYFTAREPDRARTT